MTTTGPPTPRRPRHAEPTVGGPPLGRRARRCTRWLAVAVVVAAPLVACTTDDDGERNEARDACIAAASADAGVASESVDLDGVDGAVEVDGGWGYSGGLTTPEGDRSVVCTYVDGQADVILGSAQ